MDFKPYLAFFLFVLFGCSSNQKQEEIIVFEYILGESNTKSLDLLVSDFELNLKKIYPKLSLTEAYKQYMKDIVNPKIKDWDKFYFKSEKTRNLFKESGFYDELYINNKSFDLLAKDSINTIEFNSIGKYMHALYSIKDSDSLINKYYNRKEAVGIMQNKLFVNGFLSFEPNFNNYFHKRIAVIEFSF
ncbi:hypothetical protein SAMN05444148_2057 [Winogradskyella jejuensis]|uniref:Uncharacterized protein n=2 Tax=Winogradskyella jejuensis TaxID=1089305 RepID=A0A1M5T4E5_9FLAO|nr:hypothetical protein SAMN05444148_2057 [Winogradskyella jejuensis]